MRQPALRWRGDAPGQPSAAPITDGATGRLSVGGLHPKAWALRLFESLPAGFWRIAGCTGWITFGYVVRLGTGLLVGVYIARYLGPDSYGVLNYAIGFAFLFSALAHLGLGDIVVRDLVACPKRQGEILGSATVLRIASGALALAAVAAAAWAMQADATTRLMVVVIAGGVFFEAMSAPSEWFRSQVLARPIFVAGLVGLGIASSLRVAFVLLGKPVAWFAWPMLIDAAITAAFVLAFYRRGGGPPLAQWRPNVQRMRDLLMRSWPLAVAAGLGVTQQRIDQVMLGEMLGPSEVGWYAAAARLSQLLYFVPVAIATAVFPATIRARETSRELYYWRMQAFFDVMLWLAIAISLPATLVAQQVIHVLYGDPYAPSAAVLQIHIWSIVLAALGIATGNWMIAEGLTGAILGFSVVSVLANVLLNLLLIPSYGAVGAAWATLAGWGTVLLLKFCYEPTRPAALMMLRSLATPVRRLMWRP